MMNDDPVIEYYYGDTLRCSFGFDNPNMAAVLFVCALPLLLWLWFAAWRRGGWLKWTGVILTAAVIITVWHAMSLTYSRGGLVAAACAMIYVGGEWLWQRRRGEQGRLRRCKTLWGTALLAAVLIGMTCWNGLGERSAQGFGGDASVTNRVELWGSALQMSVEAPSGTGAGTSGEQYMQWFQPTDRTQGYRTMVNSYLTFLVEHGWLLFLSAAVVLAAFWAWTRPRNGDDFSTGLWGSIFGFMIAGLFSTTMEETVLWIFPACCAFLLIVLALWKKRDMNTRVLLGAEIAILLLCLILAMVGWIKSAHDPLNREFGLVDGKTTVVALVPKSAERTLGCMIDENVLGDEYPRLLRTLALDANVRLVLHHQASEADEILCVGKNVRDMGEHSPLSLWLLAPVEIDETALDGILAKNASIRILLPEIDEDGRAEFWEDALDGKANEKRQSILLPGVGNRVDWAWSEVCRIIKESPPPSR